MASAVLSTVDTMLDDRVEAESHMAAVDLARSAAQARADAMVASDRGSAGDAASWYYYPVDTTPRTVLVEGLPLLICENDAAIQAMLQQAGLKHYLLDYQASTIGKGKKALGALHVTLVNELVAQCCVQHFLGCTWASTRGSPGLAARVLPQEETTQLGRTTGSQNQGRPSPGNLPAEAPSSRAKNRRQWMPSGRSQVDAGCGSKAQTPTSSGRRKAFDALSDSEQSTRDHSERVLASEGSDDDGLHAPAKLNWADLCDEDEANGDKARIRDAVARA